MKTTNEEAKEHNHDKLVNNLQELLEKIMMLKKVLLRQ